MITHGDAPGILINECQHASEQPAREPDFNFRGDWQGMARQCRTDSASNATTTYTVFWDSDDLWLIWRTA